MKIYILISIIFICNSFSLLAQNEINNIISDNIYVEEDSDFSDFMTEILENPLNLNSLTFEDIDKIPVLTDFEKKSILFFLENNRPIYSIYELQMVLGLTEEKLLLIYPFFRVEQIDEKVNISDIPKRMRHTIRTKSKFIMCENSIMFPTDEKYIGSRDYNMFTYRLVSKDILSAGFTFEKDRGEKWIDDNKIPYDFRSYFFEIKDFLGIKKIIIGDYHTSFGQGLIVHTPFSLNKGANTTNIRKTSETFAPYTSTGEIVFFRGVASQLKFKNFDVYTGLSYKNEDARIDTIEGTQYIISRLVYGYHETASNLANKHTINKFSKMGKLSYTSTNFRISANYISHNFNLPIKKGTKLYQTHNFEGKEMQNYSLDYFYLRNKISVFGEYALNQGGKIATLHGTSFSASESINFSFLYRKFAKDYTSEFTKAFSELSQVANEEGIYCGTEIRTIPNIILYSYIDMFRFEWAKFTSTYPSQGHEIVGGMQIDFSSNNILFLNFKKKKTQQNDITGKFTKLKDIEKNNFRLRFITHINDNISLQNRFEYVLYSDTSDIKEGYFLSQDLNLNFNNKTAHRIRIALFDAETNAGIYAYENDVAYSFSIAQLTGRGLRFYYVFRCNLSKHFVFETKLANTFKESFDNGIQKIEFKEPKTELTLQLRIKL